MNTITLQKPSDTEVTLLSNWFIDEYMPAANGEFVKVYVYLLRILSGTPASFSLEQLADLLLCTEKDILRALKYWEKEKLLSLSYETDKKLSGIRLLSPTSGPSAGYFAENASQQTSALEAVKAVSGAVPGEEEVTAVPLSAKESAAAGTDRAVSAQNAASASRKLTLTPDRVKELKQNEDIVQLLYIAEQYLGKTLTPTEMQKILFFYDGLKMSVDLIDYLIEHCVGRNHKSMRYIETVALAWAEEGITTVEMAKQANSRYGKDYYTILKAMGISGRNPVDNEISLMDTWLKEYGFTIDLIQEACSRTVLQTGQPSFQYADKILSGWKKKNVHTLDDIRVLDAEYKKRKLEKSVSRPPAPKTPNRFNNFHQREYDFDEYEKKLLNQ